MNNSGQPACILNRDLLNMKQNSTLKNVRFFIQLVNSGQKFGRKRTWHYLRFCDVAIVSLNGGKTAGTLGIFCVHAEILRMDLPCTNQNCLNVRQIYVNLQLPCFDDLNIGQNRMIEQAFPELQLSFVNVRLCS